MSSRVILVTGANGGLGQAIAKRFLDESSNDSVWLGIRSCSDKATILQARFAERCRIINLDVTQPSAWDRATKEIVEKQGRIDVLVNNAGSHQDGLLANLTVDRWRQVLSTNLDGVFLGCHSVLPTMISQRMGRIINISSLSALLAPAGQTNYAAAKAGVVALTQSLAKEVARIGITVNVVCPGYIESEALSSMSDEEKKAAQSRIPMRRFGKPEEVAAVVRFLASPEAAYVTGSTIKVDGGIL